MRKINLSIPIPCHENWDKMTESEKGRFCSSCQKTVIDFTDMSDRALAEFFKKPKGNVCGRFQQDQLDRDIAIPRKRIPWIKYFFQFTLPAFLISLKASAQRTPVKGDVSICTTVTMGTPEIVKTDVKQLKDTIYDRKEKSCDVLFGKVSSLNIISLSAIEGKVVDENGNGISYATVTSKVENKSIACDAEGNFKINTYSKEITLIATAIGYEETERLINIKARQIKDSDFTKIVMKTKTSKLGEVTILSQALVGHVGSVAVGYIVRRSSPITLIKRVIDSAFTKFSVYPNPVHGGSSIKLDLKKVEPGEYSVTIINSSGAIVQNKEIFVENKNQTIDFDLKATAAGTYFVRLTNKTTGKSYTEKIVVQ